VNIALICSGIVAAGVIATLIYQRYSTKHGGRQARLASTQHHNLLEPEWGKPELEGSDSPYIVRLPLLSDTYLDSVRLQILPDPGQTAGLVLESDEGAPEGLDQGEAATWRVRVDTNGDATTKARVTATAAGHEWSKLIDLPFSTYMWNDLTII
jgi:hypothetical protein